MQWKIPAAARAAVANVAQLVGRALRAVAEVLAAPDPLGRLLDVASPEALAASCRAPLPDPRTPVRALFSYADPLVRRIVSAIKDERRRGVAAALGALLADEAAGALAEIAEVGRGGAGQAALLVPVPIARARRRSRGYSQTELLCEAMLASPAGGSLEYRPRLLARTRSAPPQTSLASRGARLANLRGTFAADAACARRTVVVVDDVATTGATLLECRRALRVAGAAEVVLLSVARAE